VAGVPEWAPSDPTKGIWEALRGLLRRHVRFRYFTARTQVRASGFRYLRLWLDRGIYFSQLATKERSVMRFIELYQIQFQILACVGLAMLLGAAIGLEREIEDKPPACALTCSWRAQRRC
jgi:hypothetical protein